MMPIVIALGLALIVMFFYVVYLWTTDGNMQALKYENRDLRRKIDYLVEEFGEEGKEAATRWDKVNK